MSHRAPCGRGDLVRMLAVEGLDLDAAAALVGFERRAVEVAPGSVDRSGRRRSERDQEPAPPPPPPPEPPKIEARPLAPVTFVQPTAYQPRAPSPPPPPPPGPRPIWRDRPATAPVHRPLASWHDLQVRLRGSLQNVRPVRAVDVDRVVSAFARGRQLSRLPRQTRRRWGGRVQIVVDRAERLMPFWHDQDVVAHAFARLLPRHDLALFLVDDALGEPIPLQAGAQAVYRPQPDALVLVLGDVGCLAIDGGAALDYWLQLGGLAAAMRARPLALVPCPLERCPPVLRRTWPAVAWERPQGPAVLDPDMLAERAAALLRLASPALRLEPGLLRDLRRLLSPAEADAGTEADVWYHEAIDGRSPVAATFSETEARPLRQAFADPNAVAPERQSRALAALRSWRYGLPDEIWFEEIASLPAAAQARLPRPADVADARAYFAHVLATQLDPATPEPALRRTARWLQRAAARRSRDASVEPVVAQALALAPNYQPPPGVEIDRFPPGERQRQLKLGQVGDALLVDEKGLVASPVALLPSTNGFVELAPDAATAFIVDGDSGFWQSGTPPRWAANWGTDAYGAWAAFQLEVYGAVLEQRLRWIPPGRFLMGSPEDEPGRWSNEDPRHEVTIGEGFWLFATPVTQALYEAVTGKNPSQFKSPDRPVETVSWHDAQAFLGRLNEHMPGLDLVLPSEAQWEYACRAGTTDATYAGAIPDRQSERWEVIGEIGWFAVNSNGETQPVGRKRPNPWGLYDMLGNVGEWCADAPSGRYNGSARIDGTQKHGGAAERGAKRVLRGGSWSFEARDCRAASRLRTHPDERLGDFGFRPARGQAERSDARGAAPVEAAWRGRSRALQPEPVLAPLTESSWWNYFFERDIVQPEPEPESVAAQAVRVVPGGGPQAVALPRAGAFRVRSDRAELTFRRLTKPAWASGLGRDRFGLFAEITVEAVTQRLRWIPPGRFLMGSPADEPARREAEGPQREVTIGEGFWLFATQVTQALYEAVTGENPSSFKGSARPVERVSWNDAQAFLARLNERMPGLDLTLPSEAQWEYACRAGTTTANYAGIILHDGAVTYAGARVGETLDIGWFREDSGSESQPVARKKPNSWGIHDMLGNVWEWCTDHWYDGYEDAPTDGSAWIRRGADPGAHRALRGGSWSHSAASCRAAFRFGAPPDYRQANLGFRPARGQG